MKAEIEKLNRWAYEEKNSLKYQIKALEGKILNVKRRFKGEKDLATKVALGMEIEGIHTSSSGYFSIISEFIFCNVECDLSLSWEFLSPSFP